MLRAGGLLGGVVMLFLALCGRVAYLQTYGRQATIVRAERQQNESVILPARRGIICDRNGIILAGTVETQTLFIDPKFFFQQLQARGETPAQIQGDIGQLASYTDMDAAGLQKLLNDRATSRFVKVGEDLDADAVAQVRHLELPGVGVIPISQRVYPLGSIACHILGGVGADGSGIEGLELKFDKILAGRDGSEYLTKDADRRPIGVAADDYLPPRHGQHIVLTIDINIQMMTEEELAATCTQFQASRGEAVVMDPHTGEILALANWLKDYPSFNPSNLGDSPPEARLDAAVALPYEPGSTIKPFIAGPALMWGATNPGEVWPIHGGVYIAPDGRHVRDVEAYPPLTTWDALVKSSNICMSMLGERLGNARLWAALTRFGFGSDTGVELPGEDPGLVNPLRKWTHFSTESVSQGYEVMVTPLQLARAFCAVANGGRLVQPHIVEGTLDPDGNVLLKNPPPPFDQLPQVLDEKTSIELRRILCDVVIRGTAAGAHCRSAIWNIAGKTGTSHISLGKAGYSPTRYNSSFMGCAPAENPKIVVLFVIHDPHADVPYGGLIAAPGACRVITRALTYMQTPPSPALPLPPADIAAKLYNFKASQITDRNFNTPPAKDGGN